MPNIQAGEAQAWLETTKANLGTNLNDDLEASIASQVLSRVATSYDVSGWTTPETTPTLVRKIIGMKYASWYYQMLYSEDDGGTNEYALFLNAQAELLMDGVVSGANDLIEVEGTVEAAGSSGVSFEETTPVFTMGRVF
jgi:hypothetical protein